MGAAELLRIEDVRVAIDVDAVLALWHHLLVREWNRRTGKAFTIADIDNFDTSKSRIAMPEETFVELHGMIWNDLTAEVIPAVHEDYLLEYMKVIPIDLVTSIFPHSMPGFRRWLDYNFPSIKFETVMAGKDSDFDALRRRITADASPKVVFTERSAYKLKLGHNRFVDDSPNLGNSFVTAEDIGIKLYMPRWPWNADRGYYCSLNISMVGGLAEALQEIYHDRDRALKIAAALRAGGQEHLSKARAKDNA